MLLRCCGSSVAELFSVPCCGSGGCGQVHSRFRVAPLTACERAAKLPSKRGRRSCVHSPHISPEVTVHYLQVTILMPSNA